MSETDTAAWEKVLADLDGRLQLAEIALEEGTDLDPSLLLPWSPPAGLSPLPEVCRERAISVLAHHAELERRLAHVSEQISREIAQANNSSKRHTSMFAETVVPKYFDHAV